MMESLGIKTIWFLVVLGPWIASGSPSLQLTPFRRYMGDDELELEGPSISKRVPMPRYRLPKHVVPRHYVLYIKPRLSEDTSDPEALRVPGNVQITLECLTATKVITLHADDMEVYSSTVTVTKVSDPPQELTIDDVRLKAETQTLEIETVETLEVGASYLLYVEFKSRIAPAAERMNGLYLSSYLDTDGEKTLIATTQFSRTLSVRKVFPAFDEPNQKASFQINIGRTDAYHSLSCMTQDGPPEPIENEDGWWWDHYKPTPVMPATVIAFIVSDFASVTAPLDTYHPDKPVSTWVPPPMTRDNGGVFSAVSAAKTLGFYENLFNISYELPKLDSAGMPDFAAGAMENWGLNIYRTTYLLYYKGETPMSTKYSSASVIAHEVAHQWWGNLVTHTWWNDWWITEGFASYFEYVASFNVSQEFDQADRLISDDTQPAMAFDIGPASVPIHGKDTETFVEIPSTINYSKGAALIHMMSAFIPTGHFIPALQHYLKKRSYTAVDQYALFDDMTEYLELKGALPSNGLTIREIMDTWTLQTAFPLIRVSRASPTRIYLSQERFGGSDGGLFHVPISFATASDPAFDGLNLEPKFWIDSKTVLKSQTVEDTNQWMVYNVDARGYYRVLYDDHFEGLLKEQLQTGHDVISIPSRSQILDDYFVSAFESYIPIERALEMTTYLSKEKSFVVWTSVLKHLRKFSNLVLSAETESLEAFQEYILTSLEGAITELGLTQVEDEAPSRTIFRVQVLDWACAMKHPACLERAQELLTQWEATPAVNPVAVDIRATTYCAGVASEEETLWAFIDSQYSSTPGVVELRNALACTVDPAKLKGLLDASLNETLVQKVDAVGLIQRIAMNPVGRMLVIAFLDEKTPDIVTYFGEKPDIEPIPSIVNTLKDYVFAVAEKELVAAAMEKHADSLTPEVLAAVSSALEAMSGNEEWMATFGNPMAAWFQARRKQ